MSSPRSLRAAAACVSARAAAIARRHVGQLELHAPGTRGSAARTGAARRSTSPHAPAPGARCPPPAWRSPAARPPAPPSSRRTPSLPRPAGRRRAGAGPRAPPSSYWTRAAPSCPPARPRDSPASSVGTMNVEIPSAPRRASAASVRTITIMRSAVPPLVAHAFMPFSTQPSPEPSRTAWARIPAGSDPASGSDSAKPASSSPRASGLSQRSCCAGGAMAHQHGGAESRSGC